MLNNANVMVTGGAGFIGSHLVMELLNSEVRSVIVLDSLEYGKKENIPDNEQDPRVKLLNINLKDPSEEDFIEMLEGCDYLFHLAAEKHNQSIDVPDRVLDVNVGATRKLFEAAAKSGVKKVVFSSSLYANGQMSLPRNRVSDPCKPWTVYGVSKLAGEGLMEHAYSKYGLDHAIFRFYFVYGPRQYAGMGYKSVINKNFENIVHGSQPTIYGSGTQALDYIYVDDVVELLIKSLGVSSNQQVFNVGSERSLSVNELTNKMLNVAESDLKPLYTDADWTDGTNRVSDITETKEVFQWEPKVSLEEGLIKVYDWIKEESLND